MRARLIDGDEGRHCLWQIAQVMKQEGLTKTAHGQRAWPRVARGSIGSSTQLLMSPWKW